MRDGHAQPHRRRHQHAEDGEQPDGADQSDSKDLGRGYGAVPQQIGPHPREQHETHGQHRQHHHRRGQRATTPARLGGIRATGFRWRTRGSSVPVLSYWVRVSSSLLRAQRIGTAVGFMSTHAHTLAEGAGAASLAGLMADSARGSNFPFTVKGNSSMYALLFIDKSPPQ